MKAHIHRSRVLRTADRPWSVALPGVGVFWFATFTQARDFWVGYLDAVTPPPVGVSA